MEKLALDSQEKLNESPIPESVWADLLGENKDTGPVCAHQKAQVAEIVCNSRETI